MNDISIRLTTPDDTNQIRELMDKYWGGEPLVVRAQKYYPSKLEGIFALNKDEIIGFLFFDVQDKSCEIVVFEVFEKFQGIGTKMLEKLKAIVSDKGCNRIFLMTNNDNLDALREVG